MPEPTIYQRTITEQAFSDNGVKANEYLGLPVVDEPSFPDYVPVENQPEAIVKVTGEDPAWPEGIYTYDSTSGQWKILTTVAKVLAALLSGLSMGSMNVITSSDSILSAMGKLQAQISFLMGDTISKSSTGNQTLSGNLTIAGDNKMLSLDNIEISSKFVESTFKAKGRNAFLFRDFLGTLIGSINGTDASADNPGIRWRMPIHLDAGTADFTTGSYDILVRETSADGTVQKIAPATFISSLLLTSNLKSWTNSQSYALTAITRNSEGAITTATAVWPDGSTGTFTADTLSTDFPGAIDAFHITYVPASGPTKTVTQALLTRDANGAVIAQPVLTIS